MQATRQAHRIIHVSQETIGGFETLAPNFFQINTIEPPSIKLDNVSSLQSPRT